MSNRQVVERFLAEVLTGTGPATAEDLVSSSELRQRVATLRLAFPDLAVEPLALFGSDDVVAGHFLGRGTHRGLFHGVPETGRSWEARCTAVYRVEDGRIADSWVTWDLLSLLEQLGAIERARTASA